METFRASASMYGQRALDFFNSDGLIPQIVLTVVIVIALHVIISMFEYVFEAVRNYNRLTATLLPYTYTVEQTVLQKEGSEFPFVYPSNNEVNGVEFSYSFHLYVDPASFSSTATGFKNVFYKGDTNNIWPAMSPGVFLNGATNTLRVYMNAINNIKDSYVEIPNIPVGKWFHMVVVQKGQFMDVFINGNVAVRHQFSTIPVINYGNIMVLSKNKLAAADAERTGGFSVDGPMEGMISKLKYYAYAVSFSQIDSLYREGPSSKIISKSFDQTPPYFHDSWWVTRYNPASTHYGL